MLRPCEGSGSLQMLRPVNCGVNHQCDRHAVHYTITVYSTQKTTSRVHIADVKHLKHFSCTFNVTAFIYPANVQSTTGGDLLMNDRAANCTLTFNILLSISKKFSNVQNTFGWNADFCAGYQNIFIEYKHKFSSTQERKNG